MRRDETLVEGVATLNLCLHQRLAPRDIRPDPLVKLPNDTVSRTGLSAIESSKLLGVHSLESLRCGGRERHSICLMLIASYAEACSARPR